ncbi:MAG: hypothetical protein FD180_2385 [Planctomycetota bacterium]|nr:MAG: hypothetical protein FD180_2385 [Planctomycetota bacterium]
MTTFPQPDHGDFFVKTTLNDDLKAIRQATEMAKKNISKPGHYWLRAVVKGDGPEGKFEAVKMYHVDLNAGIVEITETMKGEERARRTRNLDDLG